MPIFPLVPKHQLLAAALALVAFVTPALRAGILEDRAIEDAIEKSYVFRSVLTERSMVQVYVRYGVVELSGQAADARERSLLFHTISSIPGVQRVDSRLFTDSANRRIADRWRAARLIAVLRTHADVDATDVRLEPRDGKLELIGTVIDAAQRERIEAHVRSMSPNEPLRNQLSIAPEPRKPTTIDDPSIVGMVLCALEEQTPRKDVTLRVFSREGQVEIQGRNLSPEEAEAMLRCAESVRGVRSVRKVSL